MKKLFKKKSDITSPTSKSDADPIRDLMLLLMVIISTPFVLIFAILTGKVRSPFIVVAFLIALLTGLFYLSKSNVISQKDIKNQIIQETLEEITPEEKEEMRSEISTIRETFDVEKLPNPLHPLLDVPMDMLSINYLIFMVQSGYILADGSGSEIILDRYLHSSHKLLNEKAWESLNNINTPASERVMKNFEIEMEEFKKKYGSNLQPKDNIQQIKEKLDNKLQNFKNEYNINP